jgi:hypothetical protein
MFRVRHCRMTSLASGMLRMILEGTLYATVPAQSTRMTNHSLASVNWAANTSSRHGPPESRENPLDGNLAKPVRPSNKIRRWSSVRIGRKENTSERLSEVVDASRQVEVL